MPKLIQVLNVDARGSGLVSLGTSEKIKERYGLEPINARTWPSINKTVDNLGKIEAKIKVQDVGGVDVEIPRDIFQLRPPYDKLDALVIDPIDGIFWSLKSHINGDALGDNQSVWGKLTNGMIQFCNKFGSMEIPVIVTCHDRGEKRGDNDAIVPFIQGTFKDQLGSYFDVILYTRVYRKPGGESSYTWQVIPDATRPSRAPEKLLNFARSHGSNGEIPQDFNLLFQNVEISNPKILIIGSYGTGKTYSFRTLGSVNFDEVRKLPTI